jgi:hypothetical protein
VDIVREAARLREALSQKGQPHTTPDDRAWIDRAQAAMRAAAFVVDRAQLLVVVDRNPKVQQLRIVLARLDAPW